MYFFRFEIPQGLDYPSGWHGTMNRCPRNVRVLLYNDREGYGIAQADDVYIPPEVKVVEPTEVELILAEVEKLEDKTKVYVGEHINDRWLTQPDPELTADGYPKAIYTGFTDGEGGKHYCCPKCDNDQNGVFLTANGEILQNGQVVSNPITCIICGTVFVVDDGPKNSSRVSVKPRSKTLIFFCYRCKEEGHSPVIFADIPETWRGGVLKTKCPNGHTVSASMNQSNSNNAAVN